MMCSGDIMKPLSMSCKRDSFFGRNRVVDEGKCERNLTDFFLFFVGSEGETKSTTMGSVLTDPSGSGPILETRGSEESSPSLITCGRNATTIISKTTFHGTLVIVHFHICQWDTCENRRLPSNVYRYNREPFASANGQIPQLNIWDDHDVGQQHLARNGVSQRRM